uniref:Uncharacterized protein n=1 Tax=Anguilla anguilla TaxID=7936 RepID=A0A0E9U8B9_ANGAN
MVLQFYQIWNAFKHDSGIRISGEHRRKRERHHVQGAGEPQ